VKPIPNRELRPQSEVVLDFVYASPKRRTALANTGKQIVGITVFGPKNLGPNSVFLLIEAANPLKQQGNIHLLGVKKA
jgi:hypothetical protein